MEVSGSWGKGTLMVPLIFSAFHLKANFNFIPGSSYSYNLENCCESNLTFHSVVILCLDWWKIQLSVCITEVYHKLCCKLLYGPQGLVLENMGNGPEALRSLSVLRISYSHPLSFYVQVPVDGHHSRLEDVWTDTSRWSGWWHTLPDWVVCQHLTWPMEKLLGGWAK